MKIKEIHNKAGSLPDYIWYIFLVFGWYFLDNIYTSMIPVLPGSSIETLLLWVYRMVLVPFLLVGVYGGIRGKQRIQVISPVGTFLNDIKTYYWHILVANLLALIILVFVTSIVVALSGFDQLEAEGSDQLISILSIPFSAILLFWFAGIIVDRKIFKGLFLGIKLLITNPFALAVGLAWGAIGFADTFLFDLQNIPTSIPTSFIIHAARAGVLALGRILAITYALAIYQLAYSKLGDETTEETEASEAIPSEPGDSLVKASIGFSYVSFLPLVHLVTLVLGILALRRKKQFALGPIIACWLGGFFTIFYALLITGWITSLSAPSNVPGFEFLTDSNADMASQVALLEQGSFQEINQQIPANNPDHHWTYDSLSALSKYYSNDLDGALEDFYTAAQKEPERSEFYYFYGLALLDKDKTDLAAEQFQNALQHEPRLAEAERYLNLIDNIYEPSLIVSSMGFVIILLLLFTLHEYGHAYAAWKLGDDTSKNLGRLTLNPVPHLDLFGSLILPAILLWQQSEFLFGWAKPVPVDPRNFKNPQKDHMRVSFAGPAMNLIVAMIIFVILGGIMLFIHLFWPETLSLNLATPFSPVSLTGPPNTRLLLILVVFLKQFFYTSLVLGFFNLIPVPPLDGSWILAGILPEKFLPIFGQIRRYGFLIFLLLVVTPVLDFIMIIPIGFAWGGLQILVSALGLG